jgi:hypothetical protein
LFYLGDANKVVVAEIDTSKGFQAGTPGRMFPAPPGSIQRRAGTFSPDGKRFLFAAPPNTGQVNPFTVMVMWAGAKEVNP